MKISKFDAISPMDLPLKFTFSIFLLKCKFERVVHIFHYSPHSKFEIPEVTIMKDNLILGCAPPNPLEIADAERASGLTLSWPLEWSKINQYSYLSPLISLRVSMQSST